MHVLIAFTPSVMWGNEHLNAFLANGSENLPHVCNHIVFLERRAAKFVQLSSF